VLNNAWLRREQMRRDLLIRIPAIRTSVLDFFLSPNFQTLFGSCIE
jgi:hypothetical protein